MQGLGSGVTWECDQEESFDSSRFQLGFEGGVWGLGCGVEGSGVRDRAMCESDSGAWSYVMLIGTRCTSVLGLGLGFGVLRLWLTFGV